MEVDQLKKDMATITATDAGRSIMRYIMEKGGVLRSSIVLGPLQEINMFSTVYTEAQRCLALNLLNLIPDQDIQHILLTGEKECQDKKEAEPQQQIAEQGLQQMPHKTSNRVKGLQRMREAEALRQETQ